jgi:hypothetical protein
MRVLLDEQMPAELIADIGAHEVRTVAQMSWKGIANAHRIW